jgi:hypothetical protein
MFLVPLLYAGLGVSDDGDTVSPPEASSLADRALTAP